MSASEPLSPLVGRERELVALRERLDAALAGRGSLVLIGGEAGIGKTALAEAICREAEARGALVLVGRCYDLLEAPPYGPWVDLFARYRSPDGSPSLPVTFARRGMLGATASAAALVREVGDFLAALAATCPLVLALDDLHWADPASLDLLRAVSRSLADLPLLAAATYRSEELGRHHPLYMLLPTLVRESSAVRLDLRALAEEEVRELVEASYPLADADAERLIAYLMRRAEGNPFYVGELLRSLVEVGTLRDTADGWAVDDLTRAPLPPLLRQVIDGRLDRLGDDARGLLEVAAVLGQEVLPALWARVAEADEGPLLDVVERGVAAHLVAESPEGGRVRFAHGLIRETLYEGIAATRRRRLHRHAAEVLAVAPDADPAAVAHHFRQAGEGRAVQWLIRAGERAEGAYALVTAAERYEEAAALLATDGARERERGWVLDRLGDVYRFWDRPRALARAAEARRLGIAIGDGLLAARALFLTGLLHSHVNDTRHLTPAEALQAVAEEEGLPDAPPGPFGDAPRDGGYRSMLGITAVALARQGRLAEAQAHIDRSLSRHADHPATQEFGAVGVLPSYRALGLVHALRGLPEEARAAFALLKRDARAADNRVMLVWSLADELRMVAMPYAADRPSELERLAVELERAAERAAAGTGARARPYRAILQFVHGAWDELRSQALASGRSNQWLRGPIAQARGDDGEVWSLVRSILPRGPRAAPGEQDFDVATWAQRLAAALALDAGELDDAKAWLEAHDRWMGSSGAALGQSEGQTLWGQYHRQMGDLARAREHADRARAHAIDPRQPLALLAGHRLLGELDTDAGRYPDAASHLDAALALADACAAPYERALTLLAVAELHAATGARDAAIVALGESQALLGPLEARPALARADALTARLAAPPPPAALPFGLTAREAEVLALVAQGLTDAQIADRLFISRYTVNGHTRAIYGKLGVTSRAAATRRALDHGLH